jgi:hypothetical protein
MVLGTLIHLTELIRSYIIKIFRNVQVKHFYVFLGKFFCTKENIAHGKVLTCTSGTEIKEYWKMRI